MPPDGKKGVVLRGEVLPAEHRGEVRMPAGTPLGFGFLGAAKFAAIRRVIEAYEQAALAKARLHLAEGEVANALTGREVAREQLRNLNVVLGDERNRIQFGHDERLRQEAIAKDQAELARLKLELEKMELQDKIDMVKARREARKDPDGKRGVRPDDFTALVGALGQIPGIAEAATKAKADIVKQAGGEEKVSEAETDLMHVIDAMVQGFVSKKAEGTIL